MNLVLKVKLREAVQFVSEMEKGKVLQPNELAEDCTGTINETVASVLEGNICKKIFFLCHMRNVQVNAYFFISVNIIKDTVKLVARKLWGDYVPGGTDSEALQGWLLKFKEYSKILRNSVETFIEWLANGIPPLAEYHAFISVRLITLDKQPGVSPVGVG